MEMHQVRYFLAVAELLNFTRAAERCNVSQPALTRAIQALEHELGGPLFHRERNRTHLTELGRMVLPYVETMHAQARAATEKARAFASMKAAPLTVGIMCTIGPAKLLDLFSGFRAQHAGIDIRIRDLTHPELSEQLAGGDLDVAILAQPSPLAESLHGLPLFEERFVIGAPPNHRFAKANAVRMAELDGETYLGRLNCEYWTFLGDSYRGRGVTLKLAYTSEREDWIQVMIKAGFGISTIPECGLMLEGIVARPLIDPEVRRTVQLVTVRGRPQSPAVGAFVREAMRWRNRLAPTP